MVVISCPMATIRTPEKFKTVAENFNIISHCGFRNVFTMGIHKLGCNFWGVVSSNKLSNIIEGINFVVASYETTVTRS
jgi:hypothetical protein